jgi:benzoate membrane transport protein
VTGVERDKQYISAVVTGLLAMVFGICAPVLARLSLVAPKPLIATLAGLAMLKILEASFISAFKGQHSFGALIAFLITLAGVPILNIGAPFWGFARARSNRERERHRDRLRISQR